MAASSTFGVPPTLENHFGLNIGNEYVFHVQESSSGELEEVRETKWENPYLGITITPYIPKGNINLPKTGTNGQESLFLHHDTTVIILSHLNLKNVINFSTVSKCCFLATKADAIWHVQLYNLLPAVKVIVPTLCAFSPEQQFKIIYKRIDNECKPYLIKFNYNLTQAVEMRNNLNALKLQFQKAGGEEANTKYSEQCRDLYSRYQDWGDAAQNEMDALTNSPEYQANSLWRKCVELETRLRQVVGANYDGTVESIGPNSHQRQIQNAITVLVPNAFNNQEKFEAEIRKAEASSNSRAGPLIEEVKDLPDPTDENRS